MSDMRLKAIHALKAHADDQVDLTDKSYNQIDFELTSAAVIAVEYFRWKYEVPGVRYWEYYDDEPMAREYFTTMVGEAIPPRFRIEKCAELNRYEYLAREHQFGGEI